MPYDYPITEVTSFGPDKLIECKMYLDEACQDAKAITVSWPGVNLVGNKYSDGTIGGYKSYHCKFKDGHIG